MNREIKFQVKIKHKSTGNIWTDVLTIDDLLKRNGCLYNPGIQEIVFVREFTGLKDRNGKKVYEGDILDNLEVIRFSEGAFLTTIGALCLSANHREIIGNIYENPELLTPSRT